jgi:hypothetical protein
MKKTFGIIMRAVFDILFIGLTLPLRILCLISLSITIVILSLVWRENFIDSVKACFEGVIYGFMTAAKAEVYWVKTGKTYNFMENLGL